ncbi:MAG: ABC transporter substrate-binding protein [Hahellaceae bacterium]|nr:ABC transporter substrate-binding protein [Hahellaceae bacterium]MCP5211789.1 ABC transporter substrate-binding protein [Hahellaceae bacterium]
MQFKKLISHALLAALPLCSAITLAADVKTIAITQIVEHPALDSVRKGVIDELAAKGYLEPDTLKISYESAQGNPTTASQIARKFIGEEPDVVVAIATPSAQTMAAASKTVPIVFSAVTDPVGAKLVSNLEKPGKNITGTTDMLPIDEHLKLVKKIVPTATRLGTIYNPGEANSVTLVEMVKSAGDAHGLTVTAVAANKTSEVLSAAKSLVGKVDVIYLVTDNTVISAVEAVIKVGEQNKLPVIAADTDTVTRGAIAALGFDYYDVGRQTGALVVQILSGVAPGDLPVKGISKLDLHLNPGAAQRMGVNLAPALLESAQKIISN